MGTNRISPTQPNNPFQQPLQVNNAFANNPRVTNLSNGKVKPFNGGTVTVPVTSKTTQAEVIKAALNKFAEQAGIKDPIARGLFVDRWMKNLGEGEAKIYQDGKAISAATFTNDKKDRTVSITIGSTNQGIIKDLRDMQVMSGVISIFDAQNTGRNPLSTLSGNSYEQYLGFDPSSYQRENLNSKYDDSKYKELAQNPDLADIALDLTQMGLDIVGIFEPTPFADLTNAGISAVRGNWGDAALSLIGVVPYAGDLAKIGKIPKWINSIEKISSAIDKFADVVRNGGKGKEAVEAFVNQAKQLLDKVMSNKELFDKLPAKLKETFQGLKKKVDDFFASVKKTDNPNVNMADNVNDATKNADNLPTPKTPSTTTQQPNIQPPQQPKKPQQPQTPTTKTNPSDWNKNGTGLGNMVDQALKRTDLDATTLKSIDETLAGLGNALKNGKLENTSAMRDLISNLGKADPKKVSESLAELERAGQVLKTADLAPGTKVVIGAKEGQQLSRTTGLPDIDVAKVEADVYYKTKDGVLHLNEVKDTFNALTSKIDEGIKAANKGNDPKQFERYGDWVDKGKALGEIRETLVVVRKSGPGFDSLLNPARIDELEKLVKGDTAKPVLQVGGRLLSISDLRKMESDAINKLGELIAKNPNKKPAELAKEYFGSLEKAFATLGKTYGKKM